MKDELKYKVKVDMTELDNLTIKLKEIKEICKRINRLGISKRQLKRLLKIEVRKYEK